MYVMWVMFGQCINVLNYNVRYTGVFIIKDFFLYMGSIVLGTMNWTSFIMAADLIILLYVC